MARTINDIHKALKSNFVDNSNLQTKYGLDPAQTFDQQFSKVSIENLFLYIVALSIHILEQIYDDHKSNVDTALENMRPHRLQWYAQKAQSFQYGDALVEGTDEYPEEDEEAQIISHASVEEKAGRLFMKVAKLVNEELAPLEASELSAFAQYMETVKDAGVLIDYISNQGDDLKLSMDIWYNPLVFRENGTLISDSSVEPAKDTIKEFITNLPFNGEFVLTELVDALQEAEGIDIPIVLNAQSKYGANDYENIDGKVVPNAGYMVITDENLTLNYRPNVRG
jgi:hypothetical protein